MGDPLLEQLLSGFVDEAEDIAARVTLHLLELERSGGGRSFDDLARGLHTLKGSAATLGLDQLADLAHRMEDAVLPLRGQGTSLPPPIADALLRSLDVFLSNVRAQAGRGGEPRDLGEACALLEAARRATVLESPGAAAPVSPRLQRAARDAITPPPPLREGPERLAHPPSVPPEPAPAAAPGGAVGNPVGNQVGNAGNAVGGAEGWRVQPRQVVGLLQEVERLRELRLRLDERHRDLEKALGLLSKLGILGEAAEARALLMGASRALNADSEEAADLVASLEEGLKAITTVPVRTVLEPLRRAVRDLCKQSGKEARLEVVGAELSLDRRVLESLRSPLVQLVRNAVDHGLEAPELRESRGKHRVGALIIRVEQQGNLLFLEVSDDGQGLDLGLIREAAIRAGLLTGDEARALLPQQLAQLIFRAGFTTKEKVTDVSGRGVGLDVVRTQVEQLRGQVEVQTVAGQGTRFLLSLPADLGSSPVLVVRTGEHVVGVPMSAIESSRSTLARELRVGRARIQLEHHEQLIPLHDLGALLGLRQPEAPADGTPLLIIQQQGNRVAVAVDEVIGDKELLVRPLPPEVRDLAAFQGAATLARGELILILRPDWLTQTVRQQDSSVTSSRRALVVDDSLTARALHRTALESGGYQVHTAASARQALELLRHSAYEVLVCDIGMAEMDGLQLTREIRERREADAMPVILVSAHDSDADRARGQSAGADGFLSKRDCASGRLLAEVAAVIVRRQGLAS